MESPVWMVVATRASAPEVIPLGAGSGVNAVQGVYETRLVAGRKGVCSPVRRVVTLRTARSRPAPYAGPAGGWVPPD